VNRRLRLAALVLLAGAGLGLRAAPDGDGRTLASLDSGWRFLAGDDPAASGVAYDDSAWQEVSLPHTWNARDGEDGGGNYRRGPGWYRRLVDVGPSLAGRRLYLQFDAASLMADVYVNGVHLGTHRGGFSAFRFDATAVLRPGPGNVLAVRVDNGRLGIPPTSADFTFFGGLYRGVWLLSTDPVQVSAMDMGSPGVFIDQARVSPESARILVRAEIENHTDGPRTVEVRVLVADAAGRAVADQRFQSRLEPGAATEVAKPLDIVRPHLWNGRADPYLYSVRVVLRPAVPGARPGPLSDAVVQPLGLRSFTVDAARGFFLNGAYLDLRGFNVHQDWPDEGWAITDAQEAEDFAIMLETGATAVRSSHYQHSDSWYSRCDRAGIVGWAEIPFVDEALDTPLFLENARQQMRELIRQNYNHPSICFWGVGNETSGEDADHVITELAREARGEDPGRLSTYAANGPDADPKNWRTDVVAFNRYYGWYNGGLGDFEGWLDRIHSEYPQRCVGMSEFGAGASIFQHTADTARPEPKGLFHPEEYQAAYHEAYWAALKGRPWVWAKFIWCLHDFASDGRDEGDHAGRNDKGLVTYDRKVRKDAFYFYKASWSGEHVVHINGSRFTPRTDPVTDVRVYSNAPEVALEVNGVSLGTRAGPSGSRVFTWQGVRLAPGENRVSATGHFGAVSQADACAWTLAAR
jgi:beta-galactosidase